MHKNMQTNAQKHASLDLRFQGKLFAKNNNDDDNDGSGGGSSSSTHVARTHPHTYLK